MSRTPENKLINYINVDGSLGSRYETVYESGGKYRIRLVDSGTDSPKQSSPGKDASGEGSGPQTFHCSNCNQTGHGNLDCPRPVDIEPDSLSVHPASPAPAVTKPGSRKGKKNVASIRTESEAERKVFAPAPAQRPEPKLTGKPMSPNPGKALEQMPVQNVEIHTTESLKGQKMDGTRVAGEEEEERWAKAALGMPQLPENPANHPGDKQTLRTNFFRVTTNTRCLNVRKYRIILGPEIGPVRQLSPETKRFMINELFLQNEDKWNSKTFWTCDYDSAIVADGLLFPEGTDESYDVDTPHDYTAPANYTTPKGEKSKTIRVTSKIRFEFIFKPSSTENVDGCLNILNAISWTDINHNGLFCGGRLANRFFPQNSDLEHGRIPYPSAGYVTRTGFFSAMRLAVAGFLLNVNPSTTAFFPGHRGKPWYKLQAWIINRFPHAHSVAIPLQVLQELRGLRVMFEYDPLAGTDQQRIIRPILDIRNTPVDRNGRRDADFYSQVSRKTVSLKSHLESVYGFKSQPDAFLVDVGDSDHHLWYPADALLIVPWQQAKGKVLENLSEALVKAGEKTPSETKHLIRDHAFSHLRGGREIESFLNNFGVEISTHFVNITASVLPAPTLHFRKGNSPPNGMWPLEKNWRLLNTRNKYNTLYVINLDTKGVTRKSIFEATKSLRWMLQNLGLSKKNIGLKFANCPELTAEMFAETYQNLGNSQNLPVLVVLPGEGDQNLYSAVKRWGDCVQGVPTICITLFSLTKYAQDPELCRKLSVEFNTMLKNTCFRVEDWFGAEPNTMIVGADIAHPGGGTAEGCPSMAAVVASCDKHCVRWLGSARLQRRGAKHIENLKDMIKERCLAYHKLSGDNRLPSYILFYRNGIPESHYGMVRLHELPQVAEGCQLAYQQLCSLYDENLAKGGPSEWEKPSGYSPKIVLLAVDREHNTRFYPMEDDAASNLQPGLLVDDKIVSTTHCSFYLQSSAISTGTVCPTLYAVISNQDGDEEKKRKFPPERLHQITYNLCHAGARSTSQLSVPAPVRYAGLLCERLRCYMKAALDNKVVMHAEGERTPENFAKQDQLWGSHGENRNPWHMNMDDTMFYI